MKIVKFEQNRMARTKQNFELFDTHTKKKKNKKKKTNKQVNKQQKMVNHFWQSFDAILEVVSVTETIVWCWTFNLKTIVIAPEFNIFHHIQTD